MNHPEDTRDWIEKARQAAQADREWQQKISGMAIASLPGPGPGMISNPYQGVAKQVMAQDRYTQKVVFDGRIRVVHVDNGFVVEIYKEVGNEAASVLIAKDIKEVNDLIAAAMVQFRLEDKS